MIFLSSCASAPVASPPAAPLVLQPLISPSEGFQHVVAKGETLWRISRRYQIDIDDIARINRIPDSTNISVGQIILIPRNKTAQPPAKTNFTSKDDGDFIWPLKGRVVVFFKQKSDGVLNKGIDILADRQEEILAARSGRVVFSGRLIGYGETVIIDHRDGLSTVYAGNTSVTVRVGEEVGQGTVVAKAGASPRKEERTLHFEIRKRHKPQNPLYYLN